MRNLLIASLSMFVLSAVAAAAPPTGKIAGFQCTTVAHRQSVPGAPGLNLAVVKLKFDANYQGVRHKHKFGEILFLLSGSAREVSDHGKRALSSDVALVVPAGSYHHIQPGPQGATILSTRFTDTASPDYEAIGKGATPSICPK